MEGGIHFLQTQPPGDRKVGVQVARAMRQQSWAWIALNLAWTAGPVTYLAMQGGHYLGFGTPPPFQGFIYFAGYTIIAGVLAIGMQVLRHAFYLPKQEAARRLLEQSVDRLFSLYFYARNAYVDSYPPDRRATIAAWWTLRSVATDVDMLQEAVCDMTGDRQLAGIMKRIELYRKQGFPVLMRQEYQQHSQHIEAQTEQLAIHFPGLAEVLMQRFRGTSPTMKFGQPRHAGFLDRLLVVGEEVTSESMTPDDVLAVIQLVLELLLDRVILALHPEFQGFARLNETKERLDSRLSDFRLLRRKRNSRIRALIHEVGQACDQPPPQTQGADSQQLCDLLIRQLRQCGGTTRLSSNLRQVYQEITQVNQQMRSLWKKLMEAEAAYNRQWQKDGKRLQERLQAQVPGKKQSVLRIAEQELSLDEKQKLQLARQVTQLLDGLHPRLQSKEGRHPLENLPLEDYQQLAIELANAVDEILDITEPGEQLAIEESREADFGWIEPGSAAQTKLLWGRIAVQEVQLNRTQMAHRLASRLLGYYNIRLGNAVMDYLAEKYGASREYMASLQGEVTPSQQLAAHSLRQTILELPDWGRLAA